MLMRAIVLVLASASASMAPDEPWARLEDRASAPVPTARGGHSAVWCDALSGIILFGGRGAAGALFNDVWRWSRDDVAWEELVLAPGSNSPPRARAYHSAVCSSEGLLIFGGSCGHLCFLDDVWLLTSAGPTQSAGVSWALRATSATSTSIGSPEPRAGHSAVLQRPATADERLLVFGGQLLSGAALSDDLWALSTSTYEWTRLSAPGAAGAPGGRRDASVALLGGTVHVFGGWQGVRLLDDLWKYHEGNSSWAQLAAGSPRPSARKEGAVATSPDGSQLALFGGASFGPGGLEQDLADSWTFSAKAARWELLSAGLAAPPTRRAGALVWLPAADSLLVLSGQRYTSSWAFLSDVWRLDLAKARSWPAAYAQYLRAISGAADGGEDEEASAPGDSIEVDLAWLDALFEDLPLWASGVIVFGIPSCCILLCVCSGIYRQRRRALARKLAEAMERANAEGDE